MRSLRSLARFLLEHGAGSVRRLQLDLGDGLPDHHQEVLLLLAAAATACSGLLELDITCGLAITLSAWLLPLASSLRRLRTGDFTSTVVAADSLEFMTALEDLEMGPISDFVDIEADARLPTTLTRLALGNGEGTATLPPQVCRIPASMLLLRCIAATRSRL